MQMINPEDENKRRQELASYLRTLRERTQPEEVGLASHTRRRTPGLRREEVALLANISMDWYTRLEQGRDIRVSDQVIDSLADVLQMTAAERRHLYMLAFGHQPPPSEPLNRVTPELREFLEQQGTIPAFIMGYCWDILAWNDSASWLFGGFERIPDEERNVIWMMFTPYASCNQQTLEDWEVHANCLVAQFRTSYGNHVHDARFNTLIEKLKDVHPNFAEWWDDQHVRERYTLLKNFHHPKVGLLQFTQMTLLVNEQPDLKIVLYMPVAGTDTQEKVADALQDYQAQYT